MNDLLATMIKQAKQTLSNAYAPYSNYQVAACLCSEDGTLFSGVNVENASFGLTICAESSAICQMISAGKREIKEIVIMNSQGTLCSPCGSCRQCIAEFSKSTALVHLCNHQAIIKSYTIGELLPYAFILRGENK